MSAVPAIWAATDEVCDKHGVGGKSMPKNNGLTPSWSYTASSDDVRVVESKFANWELMWNGKVVCHSYHPARLLRWAYGKHLLDMSGVIDICHKLNIKTCHVFDDDRQ